MENALNHQSKYNIDNFDILELNILQLNLNVLKRLEFPRLKSRQLAICSRFPQITHFQCVNQKVTIVSQVSIYIYEELNRSRALCPETRQLLTKDTLYEIAITTTRKTR